MAKTFLQIFGKYAPNERDAEILLSADNIKLQADKGNRIIQFSEHY